MSARTIAVVQARMGSTRLPGKVMAELGGRPLIDTLLDRLGAATTLDGIVVATSTRPENDPLVDHLTGRGFAVFRGSEDDVLARFHGAAAAQDAGVAVRITADCPFIDPELVDAVVRLRAAEASDWAGNAIERRWPDGLDVEAMTFEALDRAAREATHPYCRMHVTPYLHGSVPPGVSSGSFRLAHLQARADFAHLRWTVDEPEDLAFARRVVALLQPGFGWLELVALLSREPRLARINAGIGFNEGARREAVAGTRRSFALSNQMFGRAAEVIPLASQTFSKSYMQWPKGAAPLFLDRARGARTWDIDGNSYIDYVLGLLPVVLGHQDPDVDAALEAQLDKGITFSLPSPLETEVAEDLVRLIPCAEAVRFGKNGSDATTASIRLARAFTGRDKVLVGGYHGWHDWYIGTTTRDLGVPPAVRALSGRFAFNDAESLERALVADPDGVAAVILEPAGVVATAPGFLERVRELCTRFGAVLVFDEIITGFRIHMGGAQARFGVVPDLACFGKAMANGMPLSAIVGRRDIMRLMEDVFFSGTMGGECLSLAAARATIAKLEREDGPDRMWALGTRLQSAFDEAARAAGLGEFVMTAGEGWWPLVKLGTGLPVSGELFTTLLRQEFLQAGILLAGTINLCLAQDDPLIEADTRHGLARAFAAVRDHLDAPDPASRLLGDLIQPTFKVR